MSEQTADAVQDGRLMRLFLTGGTGVLGRRLVPMARSLAAGWRPRF